VVVGFTIPKSNMKIVEKGKIDTLNIQIENLFRSLIMKVCNFMLPKSVTASYSKEGRV